MQATEGSRHSRERAGVRLLWAAAAVGSVHAIFSLYWALGGDWLLNTVGAWAVDLVRSAPLLSASILGVVATVKLAAAAVPLLVHYQRLPWRRLWRIASGVGSVVLILYGALNTLVAWAVLLGIITSADGYDRAAQLGHAALWDPLFLLWGVLLAAGLRLTRDGSPVAGSRPADLHVANR